MPKKSSKTSKTNRSKQSKSSIERMKMEIANDLGVQLGGDASARECGSVGGQMTRRLVKLGQDRTKSSCQSNSKSKAKRKSK